MSLPNYQLGEFGAAGEKGGRPRRFMDWLRITKTLAEDVSKTVMLAVFGETGIRQSRSSTGLDIDRSLEYDKGSCYDGQLGTLTVEHVIPRNWTVITESTIEMQHVTRDARLLALATGHDNPSRGTKPLSFFSTAERHQGEIRSGFVHHESISPFLYDPDGFTGRRRAEASRATAYGFMTYALLSDVPHYAGSIPGEQMGSWLTAQQLDHIKWLGVNHPPNRVEKLIDWVRWYFFGACNPLIHEASIIASAIDGGKGETWDTLWNGLLAKRINGTDALTQILMLEVTKQFQF
jgi:hypothetical protein